MEWKNIAKKYSEREIIKKPSSDAIREVCPIHPHHEKAEDLTQKKFHLQSHSKVSFFQFESSEIFLIILVSTEKY